MRILFMGTPEFAAVSLSALVDSGHEVAAVISQPDKPKGRGHKLQPTCVKQEALIRGIDIYQPETLKDGAISPLLDKLCPELIVVVAYGRILPGYVLDFPRYGCINVHASLLPKYRGAAPIARCIMDGETQTGVTTMYMARGLDTGDTLLMRKTPIGERETASQLHDRLAVMGAQLLLDTITALKAGRLTATPQDHSCASYAHMIDQQTAQIDWSGSAAQVSRLVRAMNARPLAHTIHAGKRLKIGEALVCEDNGVVSGGAPGEVMGYEKGKGLRVACGEGAVWITQLQPDGKRMMETEAYMAGYRMEAGTLLGGPDGGSQRIVCD